MIDLRLRRLTIFGLGEERSVTFTDGLNVIVGPYGSGKTSLLELVKYALGGQARLSEAVREGVSSVALDAVVGGSVRTFHREINSHTIQVSSGSEALASLHETSTRARGYTLASAYLLHELGLPVLRVRRSARSTSGATEAISFWDVFRFAFVSQDAMGESIAGHADTTLERKMRRAFEFMFGLLDEESAELSTEELALTTKAQAESSRLAAISDFLADADVPQRGQILGLRDLASTRHAAAVERIASLREAARSQSSHLDGERDLIGSLQRDRADTAIACERLTMEIRSRQQLAAQLAVDIERLQRAEAVQDLLGPIDFTTCPRCLQALGGRTVSSGHCTLCTQELPDTESAEPATDEIERLTDVRAEILDLASSDEVALGFLRTELEDITRRLTSAEESLRVRADAYVAPLFDQIEEAAAQAAEANQELAELDRLLLQWETRARLQQDHERLLKDIDSVRQKIATRAAELEVRRTYVVEMSNTFDEIVGELELAWYDPEISASIDLKRYLPRVGSAKFDDLSGGQKTVVTVAYHLALLTTGLVHPGDLNVPSLLMLDTPSKYLGSKDESQVARNFRRVAAIVGAYATPVQIVIADNSEPPSGVVPNNRIELSYESPLVPWFEHPGEGNVQPLHEPYNDEA